MPAAHRRILVVEDEPETAGQIVESLQGSGYAVDLAVNGTEALARRALRRLRRIWRSIDCFPILTAFTWCGRCAADGISTPALIISALGEIDDRVRGLRAGGDDYLVKPFAFAEMLARVEALARRSATVVKETVLRVGDLELDLMARTANRSAGPSSSCRASFSYSNIWWQRGQRRVARHAAAERVDLHFDPATNIIDVYVGRLRRKIDGQQAYPLIHTVRGVGYRVGAPD